MYNNAYEVEVNGCAVCGKSWSHGAGGLWVRETRSMHHYTEPSNALRLERMKANRAARQNRGA
jgi:ribosomal protein L24E